MTWQLSSFVLLALALAAGFGWYERSRPPARVVGLVAVLAALAVVGRLAFAAVPNVKPTTDIVFFAGVALGAVPGFTVGAIAAIASNVFLGQGPWTVWQMAAWGGCGIGGGLLARAVGRRELGRVPLAIACGLAALAFGAFMDVYQWTLAARQDLPTYLAISGTSLPYNLAHAFGNIVFCMLIGPVFIRSLRRYRRRFEVSWAPPAGGRARAGVAATVVMALAVATALTSPTPASAASPASLAAQYLERSQNRDGGFGGAPGQSSSQLVTGWAALGLAAGGLSPRDVERPRGDDVIAYLRRGSKRFVDVGELQRTILVLHTARLSSRRFAGVDLLAKLRRAQRPDGSWEGNVAFTAFGLLALRAAGEKAGAAAVRSAADYLDRAQAPEGGWGFVPAAMSDVDDTGAALQALAAAGRRASPAVKEGVAYLRGSQSPDGGWGQLQGRSSNAQSTSWAVQGLVAARARFGSLAHDPLRYLRGLQRRDGHFSYSRTSDQTPVWVTAQALAAIKRKALPIAPAARAKRTSADPQAVAAAGASDGGGDPDAGTGASSDGEGSGNGWPVPAVIAGGVALALLAAATGWRLRRDGTPA